MDFPKSVPGVGLVGGQFVDEDPAIGRQGSLIPAAWGNAITQELLNVIQAAGLEPNEVQTDQLLEAIRTLVPERSAFARVSGTLTLPATAFGIYALADGGAAATVTLPDTEDLVEDTELLLFANHANTAAVQVKAATGQTVQGPAALMGESTTAFMLPAGGDWVRLRSEKAQGRWVVAGCFTSAALASLKARLAALEVDAQPLLIYPSGTEASPFTIGVNARIVINNPWPGYLVGARPELLLGGIWSDPQWHDITGSAGFGVRAVQNTGAGEIVVRSGSNAVFITAKGSGSPSALSADSGVTSAPLRVWLWKEGKL